jgi:hypothetical protein
MWQCKVPIRQLNKYQKKGLWLGGDVFVVLYFYGEFFPPSPGIFFPG